MCGLRWPNIRPNYPDTRIITNGFASYHKIRELSWDRPVFSRYAIYYDWLCELLFDTRVMKGRYADHYADMRVVSAVYTMTPAGYASNHREICGYIQVMRALTVYTRIIINGYASYQGIRLLSLDKRVLSRYASYHR